MAYLRNPGKINRDSDAYRFLKRINYIDDDAIDECLIKNRLAVIRLLCEFDDVFQIPAIHAPGAYFWGGLISLERFGLDDHGIRRFGVGGRGVNLQRAVESCAGEAAEFISFLRIEGDCRVVDHADPAGFSKEDLDWIQSFINSGKKREIDPSGWVKAISLPENAEVYFPVDLILRSSQGARTINSITESTGVGAGATRQQAIASGFLEVLERDAVALWWYGGNKGKRLSGNFLNESGLSFFAEKIRRNSPRPWWLLDITSDIGIPAVISVSSESDGKSVVAGSSSDFTIIDAAKGAFLEMCQMEFAREISLARKQIKPASELNEIDHMWIDRSERLSVNNYPELIGVKSQQKEMNHKTIDLDHAVGKMKSGGITTYVSELTRKDIGIPVFRTIIPQLQSSKVRVITRRLENTAEKNGADLSETLKKPTII